MMKFVFGLVLPVISFTLSAGQTNADQKDSLSLSLANVVDLAVRQSSAVKYAQNTNVNYFWRWKNFQTRFRPRLMLTGDLPDYTQTTTPVTQPDGSIEFRQVSNAQASAKLALNQSIAFSGTQIYAATALYRIQDFNNNTLSFSGTPFEIGFTQPVFSYNWMRWSKQTEPLIYEEAQKNYVETIEEISRDAAWRFFNYLKILTNYRLAENNLKNSRVNLQIAETKQKLGQISENDFARIQLSVYNAQKALNMANMELKNADFELKSYISLDQETELNLIMPLNITFFDIDPEKALKEARANRKETPRYQRRLIQADQELTQARRNTGLGAVLTGSYGMSNSAEFMAGVYDQPKQQRMLRLSMSVPILDWGRSASQVKLAESRRELEIFDVEKDREDFEREVFVQVEQFSLLEDQLKTAKEADKVAENGYLISLRKFQNGEISITDLNISLSERESARRDYISSLEDYWIAYYNLRILTLYDFEMKRKISYNNPMLDRGDGAKTDISNQ